MARCEFYNPLRQGLAVSLAADGLSAFVVFRVDPGDAINDQQDFNVITHRTATFDQAPILSKSSVSSIPSHQ
jgi:hypothetical protein